MGSRNTLRLKAYDAPFVVVVEPWAEEFEVALGEECHVVALHPDVQPSFTAELAHGRLIVCVNESGSTYEFWRGEVREFWTPIAIPYLPSSSPQE